jgi:transcription antitermination factor NusG
MSEMWHRGVMQTSDPAMESLTGGACTPDAGVLDECVPGASLSKWFAVYTSSRHEKRVGQHLEMREIEHYLPLYRTQRKWSDGSRVTLDLPLFPGYIFVCIQRAQRVRVLEVPGVLAIVGGTGGVPASLPESEIAALRSGLSERNAQPHPLLKVGQRARIRSGAFAGMEGVVQRMKYSFRVVLTLDSIMQSFAVEVDGEELDLVLSDEPPSTIAPAAHCVGGGGVIWR